MDARLQRLAASKSLMQLRKPFCRGAADFPSNASSRINAKSASNFGRIWHCGGPRVSADPAGPPSGPWHWPAFRACSAASIFPNRTARLPVRTAAARRDHLLKGIDPEFRDDVARVLELAERAADSWAPLVTDFLPPPVVALAQISIRQLQGVAALPWGGYASAERCRMLLGPEDALQIQAGDTDSGQVAAPASPELAQAVAAVAVTGNFMFDAASHPDFLGSVLGTGIDRSKVGDILVTADRGAQVLVAPQLAEHLCETMVKVRNVTVETRPIALHQLQVPAPRTERRTSVEASTRVDAVASAGFRMSRSKMGDLIKRGDVRVNWKTAKSTNHCKTGDIISCSGHGRVEVENIEKTKKGKYAVELARYV